MKKFFMLLAVAGFFSMTTISCGDAEVKDDTEETAPEGDDHEHAEGEEHDH